MGAKTNSKMWRESKAKIKWEMSANLPAGLEWEASDCHAVDCATWARSHARLVEVSVAWAGVAACELDDQALTHEL